jgi:hypothetical protein
MMVRVPVVGKRADERPGNERKAANQSELDPGIERQPHAEVVGNDRDDECDEYADDQAHRFNPVAQLMHHGGVFTIS